MQQYVLKLNEPGLIQTRLITKANILLVNDEKNRDQAKFCTSRFVTAFIKTNKYESEIIKTLTDAGVVRKNTKNPAVLNLRKNFTLSPISKKICHPILSSIFLYIERKDAQDNFWHSFGEIRAKVKNFLRLSHLYFCLVRYCAPFLTFQKFLTNLNKARGCWLSLSIDKNAGKIFRRPNKLFGQSGAQIPQEASYARSTTIIAQQF